MTSPASSSAAIVAESTHRWVTAWMANTDSFVLCFLFCVAGPGTRPSRAQSQTSAVLETFQWIQHARRRAERNAHQQTHYRARASMVRPPVRLREAHTCFARHETECYTSLQHCARVLCLSVVEQTSLFFGPSIHLVENSVRPRSRIKDRMTPKTASPSRGESIGRDASNVCMVPQRPLRRSIALGRCSRTQYHSYRKLRSATLRPAQVLRALSVSPKRFFPHRMQALKVVAISKMQVTVG